MVQKIIPYLWFDGQAEEAAKFYTSIFKDSRITQVSRYGTEGQDITGQKPGSVMTVEFEIEGQKFVALNGGPEFKITEAISFMVDCQTQEEIDYYWERLSAVPEAEQCGWLKDKFGVSWQIIPGVLEQMAADPDPAKSQPVMAAMLKMKKIDLAALVQAYGSVSRDKLSGGEAPKAVAATGGAQPASTQSDSTRSGVAQSAESIEFDSLAKILVVEDNVALADIYKTKMEMTGYICFVAHEGNEALRLIEKERPSLVLLDLMVFGVAGDQILRKMRESPWGKDIKVLVISNLNEEDAPAGLRSQGIEGYAVKANLSDDQLNQMVDEIMARSGKTAKKS